MNKGSIEGITGGMFCHAKGQLVVKSDGRMSKVEDIKVGDYLCGDDNNRRKVLSLHNGVGEMCKIIPLRGDSFIVTMDHVLTLTSTGNSSHGKLIRKGEIIDISVREYMSWSKKKRYLYKLYHVGYGDFDKSIDLKNEIDPYILGVLIGDGCLTNGCSISNSDKEIKDYIRNVVEKDGLFFNEYNNIECCIAYKMGSKNPYTELLRKYGLYGTKAGNKFIPEIYKYASVKDRLELLAGLIDTDGSNDGVGFDYITKSKQLAEDIQFLVRSIGLTTYIKKSHKKCQTMEGDYYRLYISGKTDIVQNKVPRKNITKRTIKHRSNVSTFDIETIKEKMEYFGFTVDGNHRYLLNDFTVTHNSGKTKTLLNRLERCKYGNIETKLYKPTIDTRYSLKSVMSHSGDQMKATLITDIEDIYETIGDTPVIGIDEIQFLEGDLVKVLSDLRDKYKRVIWAGLDMDFRRQPFPKMGDIMCISDEIDKLKAVCACGEDAPFSERTSKNDKLISVGNDYKAVCNNCYKK